MALELGADVVGADANVKAGRLEKNAEIKKAASAAMSPRGSGPRTRTVAVSPMACLATSDGPCIAPPIGTRALIPPRAPEHWRC